MILDCGCPGEYPDWRDQDIDLAHWPAHTLPIASFFYMPLSYDSYRQRQQADIEQLELEEQWPGFALSRTGLFGGELIRLLKDSQSPSRHVGTLPAGFRLNVQLHEGGIGTVRNTVRQQQMTLLDRARMPKEVYMAYLTCPRCADDRGGERIMVLRRWEENVRLKGRGTPKQG